MYYNKRSTEWWEIGVWIGVMLVIYALYNAFTSFGWNGGECPRCHERYEFVGVSEYVKYYACPECGKEVGRM